MESSLCSQNPRCTRCLSCVMHMVDLVIRDETDIKLTSEQYSVLAQWTTLLCDRITLLDPGPLRGILNKLSSSHLLNLGSVHITAEEIKLWVDVIAPGSYHINLVIMENYIQSWLAIRHPTQSHPLDYQMDLAVDYGHKIKYVAGRPDLKYEFRFGKKYTTAKNYFFHFLATLARLENAKEERQRAQLTTLEVSSLCSIISILDRTQPQMFTNSDLTTKPFLAAVKTLEEAANLGKGATLQRLQLLQILKSFQSVFRPKPGSQVDDEDFLSAVVRWVDELNLVGKLNGLTDTSDLIYFHNMFFDYKSGSPMFDYPETIPRFVARAVEVEKKINQAAKNGSGVQVTARTGVHLLLSLRIMLWYWDLCPMMTNLHPYDPQVTALRKLLLAASGDSLHTLDANETAYFSMVLNELHDIEAAVNLETKSNLAQGKALQSPFAVDYKKLQTDLKSQPGKQNLWTEECQVWDGLDPLHRGPSVASAFLESAEQLLERFTDSKRQGTCLKLDKEWATSLLLTARVLLKHSKAQLLCTSVDQGRYQVSVTAKIFHGILGDKEANNLLLSQEDIKNLLKILQLLPSVKQKHIQARSHKIRIDGQLKSPSIDSQSSDQSSSLHQGATEEVMDNESRRDSTLLPPLSPEEAVQESLVLLRSKHETDGSSDQSFNIKDDRNHEKKQILDTEVESTEEDDLIQAKPNSLTGHSITTLQSKETLESKEDCSSTTEEDSHVHLPVHFQYTMKVLHKLSQSLHGDLEGFPCSCPGSENFCQVKMIDDACDFIRDIAALRENARKHRLADLKNQHSSEVTKLKRQIKKTSDNQERHSIEIDQLKQQIQNFQTTTDMEERHLVEINKLKQQNLNDKARADQEFFKLREAYGLLKQESSRASSLAANEIEELTATLNRNDAVIKALKEGGRAQIQESRDRAKMHKQKYEDEIQRNSVQKLDYEAMEKMVEEMKADREEKKKCILAKDSKITELEKELGGLRSKVFDPVANPQVTNELGRLRRDNDVLQSEKSLLQKQVEKLQSEIDTLKTSQAAMEEQLAEHRAAPLSSNRLLKQTQVQQGLLFTAHREIDELKGELTKMKEQQLHLVRRCMELQGESDNQSTLLTAEEEETAALKGKLYQLATSLEILASSLRF